MVDMLTIYNILPLVVGYFLGSIPFGLLLTKSYQLGDITQIGSGNIGATNVLRAGNKKVAAFTLLGDLVKGSLAVLFAFYVHYYWHPLPQWNIVLAGFSSLLGHIFPLWLGFKGGKGVATYIGVILILWPMSALVFAIAWLVTFYFSRFSSLAALVAVVVTPLYVLLADDFHLALWIGLMSIVVILCHYQNIMRLWTGKESKFDRKAS